MHVPFGSAVFSLFQKMRLLKISFSRTSILLDSPVPGKQTSQIPLGVAGPVCCDQDYIPEVPDLLKTSAGLSKPN